MHEAMNAETIAPHIPRLRRYARALLGDQHAADDLVQDTLERALNKRHLWRPGSDLRAWLFAIMHNVFVNQLRGRKTHPEETLAEAALPAVPPAEGVQLEIRDLQTALALLPPEQREVLLLIGLESLTYAEASEALGIPIGTVMSRLFRGRERLRATMTGALATTNLKIVK
jgi:RNA polymerase sigma-70 factor (ECF subfamily)